MHAIKIMFASLLLVGSSVVVAAQPAPPMAAQDGSVTQGTIARLLPTPAGEVDGLLLDDGRLVRFPPHLSTALLAVVGQGDAVVVEGMRLQDGANGEIRAWRITNRSTGRSVTDAPPPQPGPRNWAARDMRASGTITHVLAGPHSVPNGVILDNGTVVRFPPHVGEAFADRLRPGNRLTAQGYGTSGPAGTALEAVALGSSEADLMSVGPQRR